MTVSMKGAGVARLAMLGGPRAVPKGQRILPWPVVTADDEQAVLRSLRSGRFTSASAGEPEIEGLEREWAAMVGTRYCVAVSNGTFAFAITAFCSAASLRSSASVIFSALAIAPVLGSATTSMKSLPFIV